MSCGTKNNCKTPNETRGFSAQGWSPVIVLEAVPDGHVYKVINWIGGIGIKPVINLYIGKEKYESDIDLAVRVGVNGGPGSQGPQGHIGVGVQGAQGQTGVGSQGPQGTQGVPGVGAQGSQGPQGESSLDDPTLIRKDLSSSTLVEFVWGGTPAEYAAIPIKSQTTMYVIVE